MRIVITCGPAHEPIDGVRRITNFSTGRLGVGLANHLVALGHDVTCLVGHHATFSGELRATKKFVFSTAESLGICLENIARRDGADAIFHAAAVSDFLVARAETPDGQPIAAGKISSSLEEIRLILRSAPKILPRLRGWFPSAFIVGWKYEVDGDRASAVHRAMEQVRRCNTDLCVANGKAYGTGFGICDADRLLQHARGHHDLFTALAGYLTKR